MSFYSFYHYSFVSFYKDCLILQRNNFILIIFRILFQRWFYNKLLQTLVFTGQRWSPRWRPWPWGRPRGHFEVLGLGLEASSSWKLACPRLEDRCIFWIVKILWSAGKIFWKTFFSGDRLKNILKTFSVLFCSWRLPEKNLEDIFFSENTCACALGFGLERVCPWPRNFFVSLASSLVSSTPPLLLELVLNKFRKAVKIE